MLKLNYPLTLLLVKICEEIRRLQEKELRYQRIFENTGTGLVIFGKDLVISMVNSGFEEITGYSREEVEGKKKLTEFISEPDRKIAINYHSMRSNGENPPCEYELMLIDRHENIKHILFKIDVIDSTQERVASLTEITRLKLIEKVVWENERQISLLTARMSEMEYKRRTELKTGKNEKNLHKKNIIFAGIVCKSPSMQKVCEQILDAAANDASVVIYGETGTGKDLAARAIHNMSNRSQNEFVAINCGAIPDSLFESEFFGYRAYA
ncbi:PAS modulated sigma54-dependent transcriptional regulator [Desulfonema limicola]|uniref:PAS modulated sigma54-dependent transcriptional regulator n=1 Tax=Desulfonema limicola TaxID=45656 RepID=A0A975B9Q8_9BACT|nr:sigma 54-interacting transcriptional regulator [Desulfonema limicola]QTA81526.1 PAS modulated sigma54-dependent transcriptional regulator [Desulfonema limicola]